MAFCYFDPASVWHDSCRRAMTATGGPVNRGHRYEQTLAATAGDLIDVGPVRAWLDLAAGPPPPGGCGASRPGRRVVSRHRHEREQVFFSGGMSAAPTRPAAGDPAADLRPRGRLGVEQSDNKYKNNDVARHAIRSGGRTILDLGDAVLKRTIIGLTGMALGFTVLAAPAAASSPAEPATGKAPAVGGRINTPMYVVGFDRRVATENGYEIRRHATGAEYSAKVGTVAGESTAAGALPANEIAGNCGTSWVEFDAIGGLKAQLGTGWDVPLPAKSHQWRVSVTDQIGSGRAVNVAQGLTPHRKSWNRVTTTQSGARGSAYALVETPYSLAVLENGAVCRSGGPTSYTNYY